MHLDVIAGLMAIVAEWKRWLWLMRMLMLVWKRVEVMVVMRSPVAEHDLARLSGEHISCAVETTHFHSSTMEVFP